MEQSMKRVWQGVLLLVLAFAGVNAASAGQLKLNSGKSIELLDAREAETPGGKALVLEYQTKVSLDDLATLNKEVDGVWEKFVVEAERGQYKAAVISARAPGKGDAASAREPYDTVFEKINGTWRTRLRPADKAAPLNEAAIREAVDRQVWATKHNNMNAAQLFIKNDWYATVAYADSPDDTLYTVGREEAVAASREMHAVATDRNYRYKILDISIDRKAGTARVESRVFATRTVNGTVTDLVSLSIDFIELRDGMILWTNTHVLMEKHEEYPAETGRRT